MKLDEHEAALRGEDLPVIDVSKRRCPKCGSKVTSMCAAGLPPVLGDKYVLCLNGTRCWYGLASACKEVKDG